MSETWQNFNITAGTLVAFFAGMLAVGATIVGVQSWVDDRIASRVDHLEAQVGQLRQQCLATKSQFIQLQNDIESM